MATRSGGCHCGNLRYTLDWPEAAQMRPTRCACSFCTRHAGVYLAHPRATLKAAVGDPAALSRYTFGTRTADVFICARCGVPAWLTSLIEGKTYAVVNANTFDVPLLVEAAPPRSHESEPVEARLARRARTWIATVEISLG